MRQVALTAGEVSIKEPERETENVSTDEDLSGIWKFNQVSSWAVIIKLR